MPSRPDHVIVGAGTAGCILANRLSADPGTEVLLLEAGPPDTHEAIPVPAEFIRLQGTDHDWDYETTEQPGLDGRRDGWPRGRGLGGSSSINGMVYVRGHPHDFDDWAARGNEGWDYDSLLPYWRRAEDFAGGESAYHGAGGPLSIDRPDEYTPVSETLIEAAVEAGLPRNADFNAGAQRGVGHYHLTWTDGERHSAAMAYLHPVADRPNLTVRTGARVLAVTFDGQRATGVVYQHEGAERSVAVDGEVILAAGAIDSPKLLMLSGVGPADHLAEHDIDVVADRPGVGRNLQDHLLVHAVYACADQTPLPETSNLIENGAFERTDPSLSAPDMQYYLVPPAPNLAELRPDPEEAKAIGLSATQLRPESRGRVTLRSADPEDDPVIDAGYLTEPPDLERLIGGIRRLREIAAAPALADVIGEELRPGADVTTDAELEAYARATAKTNYHPVGTATMGADGMAVVDDRLRVHGVAGLRVVDASIMPRMTGGNTNAPTIAIAERGADLIREGPPA